MKEKLTLADLGRVFEDLCANQKAGDVPGEPYEQALRRLPDQVKPTSPPLWEPAETGEAEK
jgi:hypothetical protein